MAKKRKKTGSGEPTRGKESTRKQSTTKKSSASKKKKRTGRRESSPPAAAHADFAVVGLGASAGGLEAFTQFFTAMPEDTGMAFVLIQHLDPTHASLTAELLGKHTGMTVVQATDEIHVEPNHVYVIPPNCYLTISGETLHLTEPVQRRGVRVPIDFFLRSLAEDQRERAIGIVLSGTGTDGTLGAREIKASGGMVMVQAPETAQYDGMPRSTIATGVVDYVVPVEKMPDILIRYVQHWYVNGAVAPTPVSEPAPDHLTTIIGILRARLKYDFSCYKKGTLTRRIERRMGLMHVQDMGEYIQMLRQKKAEVNALYKDLLIGVTNFFREPEAWQALKHHVIEPLVAGIGTSEFGGGIRVWTPGCATGEEPYSIAMLINETMQEAEVGCDVNIFASDIDVDALAIARAGVYPEAIAADVTPDRLRRFFIKGEHTYRINKDIREDVVFAAQNLISDPPFSKLDLISCRNLLIYLEPEIQQRIISLFHFALRAGGCLILGNAETINHPQKLFQSVSRKWRIFRRVGSMRSDRVDLPFRTDETARKTLPMATELPDLRARHLSALAQQHVIRRFAPACVMVNPKGEILFLSGPVDEYLRLPTGEPTLDLFATARPGLRTKLRAALNKAIREGTPLSVEDARVKRGKQHFPIRVTIEPVQQAAEVEGLLLLVAFDEAVTEDRVRVVYVEPPESEVIDKPATTEEYESVIRHLEGELTNTREDLQTTVEELETSNEEFKASNEEVTSINEELQSTNEELETSKEELQSSSAAIISLRLDGTVTHWNASAQQLFGYSPDEVIGKDVRMLSPPERQDDLNEVQKRLLRDETVRGFETIRLHRDGTRINVSLTVSLIRNSQPMQICGIVTDIRERKRLEERLAEVAENERRSLGRDLHDTLAQQITGVGMLTASLRDELPAGSSADELIDKLESNVQRMQKQVRTMTDGLLPVDLDGGGLPAALERLAAETTDLFQVPCEFVFLDDVPLSDDFIATQLFMIAREATHNAAKHAQASVIKIRLKDHDGIHVTVTDDGIGMPSDVKESSGMGLPIMSHRAGLIGAELHYESPSKGGTIVRCFLPLREGVEKMMNAEIPHDEGLR